MGEDLLHERINLRGELESIRAVIGERERLYNERQLRVDERFKALDKALRLQATEYERRLHDLNGEYKRDRERQKDYLTIDKFETAAMAETQAREREVERMNERFDDYLKMYEVRHRELENEVRAAVPRVRFDDYIKSTEATVAATLKSETEARERELLRTNEKFEEYVKRYEARQREVDLLLTAQKAAADEAKRAAEDEGRRSRAVATEQARKTNRNLGYVSLLLGVVVIVVNVLLTLLK